MRYTTDSNLYMEEKELVEKLNRVSQISAESIGHRARLRFALLTAHEKIQKSQRISAFAWKIIPTSAFALMFLVFGLSQEPVLTLKNINTASEVKQILEYDKQTESLMVSGAVIENTKIINDRAYVLMRLPKKNAVDSQVAEKAITNAPTMSGALSYRQLKDEVVDGEIYLAEIDLINKKVIKVEEKTKQKEIFPDR